MISKVAGAMSGLFGLVVSAMFIFAPVMYNATDKHEYKYMLVCDDINIATDLVVGGPYEDASLNADCWMENSTVVEYGHWIAAYSDVLSGAGYLADVALYHATVCGTPVIAAVGYQLDPHLYGETAVDAGMKPLITTNLREGGCDGDLRRLEPPQVRVAGGKTDRLPHAQAVAAAD